MKAVVFPIESDVFQSRLLTFTHFISDPEVKYLSETLTMPVKSAQTHGATTAGYKGIN